MGAELVLTEREEFQEEEKGMKGRGGWPEPKPGGTACWCLWGGVCGLVAGHGVWTSQADVRGPCCEPHMEALSGLGSWTACGLR